MVQVRETSAEEERSIALTINRAWRADMQRKDPIIPNEPLPVREYAPPAVRRRSQAVEQAAQQWDDLEADLNHWRDATVHAQAELEASKLQVNELTHQLALCRADNDQLKRDNERIHTKVGIAASIILTIRNDDPRLDAAIAKAGEHLKEGLIDAPANPQD